MLLLTANVSTVSAISDLSFKRAVSVHEWGGTFSTKASIDNMINETVYMNSDAIMMSVGSEYFEAVRDPTKANWDSRASWNMLEYTINKAHAKHIQVHVVIAVNSVGLTTRAEYKLWSNKYNIVTISGVKDKVRLDMAYPTVATYEIGLITFIAKHYPTLDGIHIEEPFYTTQSYSPPIVDRVKAKYNGYNIIGKSDNAKVECRGSSLKGLNQTICPTFSKIYNVERDVFVEFFTKLRASVNANKANPNLKLSANAFNSYRPLHGFDPEYMSDHLLLDWYVAQVAVSTTSAYTSSVNILKTKVNDIPVVPATFITYTSIYPTSNPVFLQQLGNACKNGGNAEWTYAYAWRNMKIGTTIARTGIHNLKPSTYC
ncbi:MAG: hypothetical protein WA130_06285 [Candidatus Methanoperedens sp.]